MKTTWIALALLLSAGNSIAEQANFIPSDPAASGWVNLSPTTGGQYLYVDTPDDKRPSIKPILLQLPVRTDYTFFSPQEQDALESLRDRQLASWQQQQELAAKPYHRGFALRLAWPRVVIRGQEICVPELPFSEQPDWRDHLTCWSKPARGTTNVQ